MVTHHKNPGLYIDAKDLQVTVIKRFETKTQS